MRRDNILFNRNMGTNSQSDAHTLSTVFDQKPHSVDNVDDSSRSQSVLFSILPTAEEILEPKLKQSLPAKKARKKKTNGINSCSMKSMPEKPKKMESNLSIRQRKLKFRTQTPILPHTTCIPILNGPRKQSDAKGRSAPPSIKDIGHMFETFHQSIHGDSRPTFQNPFVVKRRKRTTSDQLQSLEHTFEKDPNPGSDVRRELASRIGMTPRAVQVWFQNRRAKSRIGRTFEEKAYQKASIGESSHVMIEGNDILGESNREPSTSGAFRPLILSRRHSMPHMQYVGRLGFTNPEEIFAHSAAGQDPLDEPLRELKEAIFGPAIDLNERRVAVCPGSGMSNMSSMASISSTYAYNLSSGSY
jgi:hypothetical protein